MDFESTRRRIRGSLLAGAVGDALGAPIEFMPMSEIRRRFGPAGITGYAPAYGRDGGAITDDTQMTLFTAEGLIRTCTRVAHRNIGQPQGVVLRAYLRWLRTQQRFSTARTADHVVGGWLISVGGLSQVRAPGNTCLTALESGMSGTIDGPINNSKGCGGVMRVAPAGLVGYRDPFRLGADLAALTHGHPSGFLSAGVLASMVASLCAGHPLDEALAVAIDRLVTYRDHRETLRALELAQTLARRGRPAPEDLETLGGGWVGEEALAISVCCALSARDLTDGLLLAVNHSGDSDSTGSITGNLLGARDGDGSIAPELLARLELREVITTVADDLAEAFHGRGVGDVYPDGSHDDYARSWLRRYPEH